MILTRSAVMTFALLVVLAACSGSSTPPSCAAACAHAAQSSCRLGSSASQCESDCNKQVALAQQQNCLSEADDALTCLTHATLSCDAHGDLVVSECDAQMTALDRCQHPPPVPPAGCESIPYPTGGYGCSSAGSASNMPAPSTTVTCSNSSGHTWASTCTQSSCSCEYDGKMVCTCAPTDGGAPCCPGT